MARRNARAGESKQISAMIRVLDLRIREAEATLREARDELEEAKRYHGICQQDHDTEDARLKAVIAYLRAPEVANNAPRYAEMLNARDIIARDLSKERFMLQNASRARDAALDTLSDRRIELSRIRARQNALCERLASLKKARNEQLELVTENEVDELVSVRQLLPQGVHG